MADITKELVAIKEAKYGRDVRQSIHDAIDAVNSSAEGSAYAAEQSAQEAKASEDAAKTSEDNAKASEDAAKTSEDNAKASEDAAKTSEDNAKASEDAAKTSEDNAKTSELLSKSYAVGGSGLEDRTDEDIDNAKYYADQAKAFADVAQQEVSKRGFVKFKIENGHVYMAKVNADNVQFRLKNGRLEVAV